MAFHNRGGFYSGVRVDRALYKQPSRLFYMASSSSDICTHWADFSFPLIFFKPTQVLARMNSKYSESTSWKIIKFQEAIFFIVFCIDVSAITHYISQ